MPSKSQFFVGSWEAVRDFPVRLCDRLPSRSFSPSPTKLPSRAALTRSDPPTRAQLKVSYLGHVRLELTVREQEETVSRNSSGVCVGKSARKPAAPLQYSLSEKSVVASEADHGPRQAQTDSEKVSFCAQQPSCRGHAIVANRSQHPPNSPRLAARKPRF